VTRTRFDGDEDPPTVSLRVARPRNRDLLVDLLDEWQVAEVEEGVPAGTDLCVVDERGFAAVGDALADWKRGEAAYAPVLLLAETDGSDPWARHADDLGERIDAIQPIPAPKSGILTRVRSLLDTRAYSLDLAEERRLNEQIFETSPIAKVVLDAAGTVVRANQRAEAVLGLSRSELAGREYDAPAWNVVDEDGERIPSEELPFATVMATGEAVYGHEHGIERPDGTDVWLSVNMAPIRDETGAIEYVVAAIEDETAERRLRESLRESEALHRATLSNIRDTVFITDDDGRFTYVCPNTRHLFGATPDEIREMGSVEALLGDPVVGGGEVTAGAYENVEREITDADGETHTVLVTVDPVSIETGTRLYTIRDITDRKAEAERFRAFVDSSSDIITVVDDEGTVGYVSPAIEAILGYDQSALVGETVFEYVHPADRERLAGALSAAAGQQEIERYRIRHADGAWRWLESVASVDALPDGSHVVNSRDVTERVRAEKRQRALEKSRSLALAAANAGIWEWDLSADEVSLDQSCEGLFGLDSGSFDGTIEAFLDRVHPEDRRRVRRVLQTVLGGTEPSDVTFRIVRPSGTERWVNGRWTVLDDGTGESRRLLGVNVDVTERQEQLRQLRVLDDVLRHNFRNHMNIVRGYAETVQERATGDTAEDAREIIRWSDRLLDITDKQRAITKVLSAEAAVEPTDVIRVVAAVAAQYRSSHPDVTIETEGPEVARALATRDIDRALSELVENAIAFNDSEQPRVTLRVRTDDEGVRVEVADNGPGIPEMDRRVVAGERDLDPLYHGSGLGLWLVSLIVRRSEGTLSFESGPDGATVVVHLQSAGQN